MNTKEKIIEALEGIKEFEINWVEEVTYSKIVKAKSEKEVRELFENGKIAGKEKDIADVDFIEDSLEIDEVNE